MEKIKVKLLVKGNIIVSGNVEGNVSGGIDADYPDIDTSDAVVVEGDMVCGTLTGSDGWVVATGNIILISGGHDHQSCDPKFLKGDEPQPADKGWHTANHGVVHGAMVPCGCPFFKSVAEGKIQTDDFCDNPGRTREDI